jgi:hypothetical protein
MATKSPFNTTQRLKCMTWNLNVESDTTPQPILPSRKKASDIKAQQGINALVHTLNHKQIRTRTWALASFDWKAFRRSSVLFSREPVARLRCL